MATSSEDILLVVGDVRHKKTDGLLYVTAERLAWMMTDADAVSIGHRYADVKMQKISPEGKSKVQLQVVLHAGGATTFQFVNPNGAEAQIRDRDAVKELLQQLLPKFKRKVDKELEEKNRILAEDPELCQLYKDLVTSQVLTPEEFWANHVPKRAETTGSAQDVGVSGSFLAGIKPQSDGCNGLKYNLTADIIESIFKTYPAVKKKHLDYVPDKLSESEFWTRFFQSHYFHRDRLDTGTKDIFSECCKNDEQDVQKEIRYAASDALLDVTSFTDSTLDEEYGMRKPKSQGNLVNQNMIRRFNHHSMMVLKTCETEDASTTQATTTDLLKPQKNGESLPNGLSKSHKRPAPEPVALPPIEVDPVVKKAKLQSKLTYEDLESVMDASVPTLNLSRSERYFHGPTPVLGTEYGSHEELTMAVRRLRDEVGRWKPTLTKTLNPDAAVVALGELSPGGALMKRISEENLQQTIPQSVRLELKRLYAAGSELSRHFWSCFPVTTEQLEEKLMRMRDNLERFQYAKIIPFQDELLKNHYDTKLLDHLKETVDAAFTRFATWQTRRVTKR